MGVDNLIDAPPHLTVFPTENTNAVEPKEKNGKHTNSENSHLD